MSDNGINHKLKKLNQVKILELHLTTD